MASYVCTDLTAAIHAQRAIDAMGGPSVSALLLDGPPGVGKSSFAKHLADLLNAHLLHWQIFPGATRRDMLRDTDDATGQPTDGILVRALQASTDPSGRKVVLLLDELDKADAQIDGFLLNFLQEGLLQDPRMGTLRVDTSRLLVVLTKNDMRPASLPLLRRCRVVYMDWPSEEAETRILLAAVPGLTPDCCSTIIPFARKLRENPSVTKPPSTPELSRVAGDLMWLAACGAHPTVVGTFFVQSLLPVADERRYMEKSPLFIGTLLLQKFLPAVAEARKSGTSPDVQAASRSMELQTDLRMLAARGM